MPSPVFNQQPFLHIQQLTEMTGKRPDDIGEETVEIYMVFTGEVTIHINRSLIVLEKNNLYCCYRNDMTDIEAAPGTAGYIIRFSKRLLYADDYELLSYDLSAFHALVLRNEVAQVDTAFLKEGKQICEMMYHEFRSDNDYRKQVLRGFLGIFLLHLIRTSSLFVYVRGSKRQHILMRKFNALLEQEFKNCKKVSCYANMLSVTPSYLNEIIKQVTGKSVGMHIRERVVLEAVRQAISRGASLKEVAYNLGFSDSAHFSKFFKNVSGMNFSDIKRSYYSEFLSLSSEKHMLSRMVHT